MKRIINVLCGIGILGVLAIVYFFGGFAPDFNTKAQQCFQRVINTPNDVASYYYEDRSYDGYKKISESIQAAEITEKTSAGMDVVSWNGYWGLGGKQGTYGRMSVPSLGVSVALNYSSSTNFQEIVDAEDSALITDYWEGIYLADHNYQGASAITKAIPDKTIMYIRNGDKVYTFICSMKDRNIYYDGDIWFDDGRSAMDFSYGDLIFQTCENEKNTNCITWWKEKY